MPNIKKPEIENSPDEKKALELLRQNQGEAAGLLRQDQKKALELLNKNQEDVLELLNKNRQEATKLLHQDQERAAELLLIKKHRRPQSVLEKKKVAELLKKDQKEVAEVLSQEQNRALELFSKNQRKALELLRQNQGDAAGLLLQQEKKASELLYESRTILENSKDAIIGMTLEGVITSWNGGAVRMFGYSPEEVIGKSGSILFPPEMWAKIPVLLDKIRNKDEVGDYNIGGLRKDGTKFDMAISIAPIITHDGTVIGASVVERDITEREKIEKELRESNEKFSVAFQTSPYAIAITHIGDDRFIEVNDAFTLITGFTREGNNTLKRFANYGIMGVFYD